VTIPSHLAANIAWLFTEHPWPDRFRAARDAGFSAVEMPWPDDPAATAAAVRASRLEVAMLNMPAGNLAAGDRGWPNDPARTDEWRAAFHEALDLASTLAAPLINVLAGNRIGRDLSRELDCLESNLAWALERAASRGVGVVTEVLNRRENPAYLIATLDDATPLVRTLAPVGWRLQLDTYHLALSEVDVPSAIRTAGGHLGHLQVADAPGRNEPGTGTLDWAAMRHALEDVGYQGMIGFEYRPRSTTLAGLPNAVRHITAPSR
jgi:hydroxypyruvate isomerase